MENNDGKLTPDQLANWRKVLPAMFGPFAALMTDEDVQRVRDSLQGMAGDERKGNDGK